MRRWDNDGLCVEIQREENDKIRTWENDWAKLWERN